MTQDFVTLPRETVEQALKAMEDAGMQRGSTGAEFNAIESLRAALEQPQNHVPDAGNTVPTGWKLVPVEPTNEMVQAWLDTYEGNIQTVYRAMLAAAPQPPVVEQQQVEQEPVAWMVTSEMQDGTRSTYPMIGRFKDVQDCCDFGEPVPLIYQHPQPKREPLTDKQISRLWSDAHNDTTDRMAFQVLARAIEAAHNIK